GRDLGSRNARYAGKCVADFAVCGGDASSVSAGPTTTKEFVDLNEVLDPACPLHEKRDQLVRLFAENLPIKQIRRREDFIVPEQQAARGGCLPLENIVPRLT